MLIMANTTNRLDMAQRSTETLTGNIVFYSLHVIIINYYNKPRTMNNYMQLQKNNGTPSTCKLFMLIHEHCKTV